MALALTLAPTTQVVKKVCPSTAYYSLLTTHYVLLTTYYSLLTTCRYNGCIPPEPSLLLTTYYVLLTTGLVGTARGTAHRRAGVRAGDAISAPSHGHDTSTA